MAAETRSEADFLGNQLIGFSDWSRFTIRRGTNDTEIILTSPEISSQIQWDEAVASWNCEMPEETYLRIDLRAIYPEHSTKYYVMGLWSPNPASHPRESVLKQKDHDGTVITDTLKLQVPCREFQVRITLGGTGNRAPVLKLLTVCLTDTKFSGPRLPPNRSAWGVSLDVPERSQMAYPNGGVLCSPTTVSMILAYWAAQLGRPELDKDVPEVASAVFDANWHGTGNWPFNTAYAGSFVGMRGFVTRLSDVSELEDLVASGVPVGLSLCYNRLRGKSREPSGHLVVCVGFTETGDVVVNDPGTTRNVRKTFPRANLVDAWAYSKNAAYLIYPADRKLPRDRFGHWRTE